MARFKTFAVPAEGERIEKTSQGFLVPDHPIIPFIEGDGIGPDVMRATQRVINAAVEKAYDGQRRLVWMEIFAGEKAYQRFGEWLPQETIEAIAEFKVALKGPLTTPVGGGFRSLNVTLRQELDLYACVRPVRWFRGVPSPVREPWKLDVVIFRESTEDVYAGIEWPAGTPEALDFLRFLKERYGIEVREDSGIGVKPVSEFGSKRLVRMALRYALQQGRRSVTLVHKGNIMKYTEGAFREWGYQVAKEEFGQQVVTEEEVASRYGGQVPEGCIVIKDRIADNMFQQVLTRPDEYDVIATLNLNGDYLSDACAAQVGGLGMAPSGNVGDEAALFEATHGTAPKYANQDVVNPSSLILSAVMMLEHIGWKEAARKVVEGLERTIEQKTVTYDLHRLMEGATRVGTSQFATHIIENMP